MGDQGDGKLCLENLRVMKMTSGSILQFSRASVEAEELQGDKHAGFAGGIPRDIQASHCSITMDPSDTGISSPNRSKVVKLREKCGFFCKSGCL